MTILKDKIAIVTGCNGEFGSAIVPGFAAAGCDIACVDFKQVDADTAAEKVRQQGRRALAIAIDLRQRAEVDAMVQQVIDAFARIDEPAINNHDPSSCVKQRVLTGRPYTDCDETAENDTNNASI